MTGVTETRGGAVGARGADEVDCDSLTTGTGGGSSSCIGVGEADLLLLWSRSVAALAVELAEGRDGATGGAS